jgi:hypothetical protein
MATTTIVVARREPIILFKTAFTAWSFHRMVAAPPDADIRDPQRWQVDLS